MPGCSGKVFAVWLALWSMLDDLLSHRGELTVAPPPPFPGGSCPRLAECLCNSCKTIVHKGLNALKH